MRDGRRACRRAGWGVQKCRSENARPECDFRYFSNAMAAGVSRNAIAGSEIQNRPTAPPVARWAHFQEKETGVSFSARYRAPNCLCLVSASAIRTATYNQFHHVIRTPCEVGGPSARASGNSDSDDSRAILGICRLLWLAAYAEGGQTWRHSYRRVLGRSLFLCVGRGGERPRGVHSASGRPRNGKDRPFRRRVDGGPICRGTAK